MELQPVVTSGLWRGLSFAVPVSLALWALIVYALSITFC